MELSYATVEAFTIGDNQGYTGNPAAVCFLETDDQLPDDVKQKIANTLNLSETAFVARAWSSQDLCDDDEQSRSVKRTLRWFTPKNEVPLCGHATLASAKALAARLSACGRHVTKIEFQSKFRGTLTAQVDNEGDRIALDFPANYTQTLTTAQDSWLTKFCALALGDQFQGIEDVQDIQYSEKETSLVIRLKLRDGEAPETTVKLIQPNFEGLRAAGSGKPVRLVIVTIEARDRDSDTSPQFYSRVFVPWFGINEDPVTGVAHTMLTPYWSQVFGSKVLYARQASARQGDLKCVLMESRVEMSGRAKIFSTGTLFT